MACLCWLWPFWCWLRESNLFLLIIAILVAVLLISNVYAGFALCQESAAGRSAGSGSGSGGDGDFDYGPTRGPHTWRVACNNQSPINIDTQCAEDNYFDMPLIWSNYDELPLGIRLENNGHTLVLRAAFQCGLPFIDGGDFLGRFDFHEISFRWSWYNTSGSEHTLDHLHYPLEMQCQHSTAEADESNVSSRGLLMVSYFFEISEDNPYLDVLIQHLVVVQQAGQCVEIPPFPLSYLMPAFYTDFYSYHGSLTEPPCHRGAEWLIYPVPLAIGERQLQEFRQLRSHNGGRIGRNARPVQQRCGRTVEFNHYRRC